MRDSSELEKVGETQEEELKLQPESSDYGRLCAVTCFYHVQTLSAGNCHLTLSANQQQRTSDLFS